MRLLHVTHNDRWFPFHFDFLKKQLGIEGETYYRSQGNFSAEIANQIWEEKKDYFNSFDSVFVSHCTSWARVFLQNGWTKPIYIWMFYKFDHDVPDQRAYYDLLRKARSLPNVKIFAATESDRRYAHLKLGSDFSLDIVPPFACVDQKSKSAIPCGPDKFFVPDKHNECILLPFLQDRNIPLYHHCWAASVPDLRGVRGIIHFPYVTAVASMLENFALGNVYFLPSKKFIEELIDRYQGAGGYFWDSFGESLYGFGETEWYRPENEDLFVYFNSFDELKKLSANDDLILDKKFNVDVRHIWSNAQACKKWKETLS